MTRVLQTDRSNGETYGPRDIITQSDIKANHDLHLRVAGFRVLDYTCTFLCFIELSARVVICLL